MDLYFRLTLGACVLCLTSGQYHAQYRNPQLHQYQPEPATAAAAPVPVRRYEPEPYSPKVSTPAPLILTHKQSLTHDGGFAYAFAADNGLQQGESIAPDGTRSGGYSYVDPHGKTITVKYTAGKEGFRILEGDHIPKSPQPSGGQQSQGEDQRQYSAPQQTQAHFSGYAGPQTFAGYNRPKTEDDGQYRVTYAKPQGYVPSAPLPRYLAYKSLHDKGEAPNEVASQQQEPEYNDEPGKPHSFGVGYSFEFAG